MRILALLLVAVGGCLAGCQITLTDNGEFGMRAGYNISFYHNTSRTDSTTVAKVESQPLTDWLKRGAPQQTDGTPLAPGVAGAPPPATTTTPPVPPLDTAVPTGSMAVPAPGSQ